MKVQLESECREDSFCLGDTAVRAEMRETIQWRARVGNGELRAGPREKQIQRGCAKGAESNSDEKGKKPKSGFLTLGI